MIVKPITKSMKSWARYKEKHHVKGKRFQYDMTTRDGVYIGYLGDSVFHAAFPDAIHADKTHYDFILHNHKIEVKSYWSKHDPLISYFVQVPDVDFDRCPEFYVFCCINSGYRYGTLLGWSRREFYEKHSVFRKKGDIRPGDGVYKLKYKTDCYEMPVFLLEPFKAE
jgi:hypothetical protein